VGIIRPQYLIPAGSVPTQASLILAMYAAARTIPLALFALWAIYKQAIPALLILGALTGAMLYRRPPILRGVYALQIRTDHCRCAAVIYGRQARIGNGKHSSRHRNAAGSKGGRSRKEGVTVYEL